MRITYTEEDKPLIAAAITKLLLADPAQSIEEIVASQLIAAKLQSEQDQALAAAQRLLAGVRAAPMRFLRFKRFYGIGTDHTGPQCDIELSDGIIHISLLGGLDKDTGKPYLVCEADQSPVARTKWEIRRILRELESHAKRQKILQRMASSHSEMESFA